MADYAIGDIQGCYDELRLLLDVIAFDEHSDTLWIAGDLINRGPNSLAVLKLLHSLRARVKIVLGNHDLHFLAVAAGSRKATKKDTFNDVFKDPMAANLIHWLRQQPLFISCAERNISMAHAGIPHIWDLTTALSLAKEVEDCLKSNDWIHFTAAMYGNTPERWDERLERYDRLRVITNYLTRMRFCQADGTLDLDDKSSIESSRKGFQAWFTYENTYLPNNHEIIFGHWAALEGVTHSSRHHALDTGCVWGGALTAMNLDNKQRFTHNNN